VVCLVAMASPRRAQVVGHEEDAEDRSPSASPRRSRAATTSLSGMLRSGGILPPGVRTDELGTEVERDKNRKLLKELYEDYRTFRDSVTVRMESLSAQNYQLSNELAQSRNERAELVADVSRSRSECSKLAAEMARLRDECQAMLKDCKVEELREVTVTMEARVRGEFQAIVKDLRIDELRTAIGGNFGNLSARSDQLTNELDRIRETFRIQVGEMSTKTDNVKEDLSRVQHECGSVKKELLAAKEQRTRLQEHQKEIEKLKNGTQSLNDITRLEAKSDLAAVELQALRRQLLERGVLIPVRPERDPDECKEEERPPVGTVELREDIFSTRLLLRLGLLKAKREADEDEALSSDGEYSSMLDDSNVMGLVVPDVEEGTTAHSKLVYGWGGICSVTFFVQTVVLFIMLGNGLDMGQGECFEHPPSFSTWFLLHTSKALAMLVAGTLMGKELMDIANYWMVAELLMPNRCVEVMFTAVLRVLMNITLIGANIVIFLSLTNPAEVWLNMTALAFIASLGADVLDVAKSGVFGHHIAKMTTTVNFQLTFVSEYPHWFAYVRTVTTTVMAAIVVSFAYITFTSADPMCH